MVSKSSILRRSGDAVAKYCELIGFKPDALFMIGVGIHHEEAVIMRELWDNLAVFGFEPHPKTFEELERKDENGKTKFPGMLYPYAISNESGRKILYSKDDHKDGATLFARKNPDEQSWMNETEVETKRLDEMLHLVPGNTNWRCLLWLDCEGSELQVLEGAEEFLGRNTVKVINVELTGRPRFEGWSHPKDVHEKLLEYGYKRAWCHSTRAKIGQIDSIYLSEELFDETLCCCPCMMENGNGNER